MVGLREAESLAHQMESYLDALRQSRVRLTPAAIDALAAGITGLETVIASFHSGGKPTDISLTLMRLSALSESPSAALEQISSRSAVPMEGGNRASIETALQAGLPMWQFKFIPSAARAERGINVNVVRQRLRDVGEMIHAAPQVLPGGEIEFSFIVSSRIEKSVFDSWISDGITCAPYEASTAVIQPQTSESGNLRSDAAPAFVSSNAIRVDLAKLDDVMRMVGDLVITRTDSKTSSSI